MGKTADVYKELRDRYLAGWSAPPTEFPNEQFTIPVPASFWARFTIDGGDESPMGIGDGVVMVRTDDQLIIQLFVPMDAGDMGISSKVDELADAFRNWSGAITSCKTVSIKRVGNNESGWYQINVLIPFQITSLH